MSEEIDRRYVFGRVEIERFEEASEEMGYAYFGFNYTINCGIYFCSARVYDDDDSLTIMDISPPSHGHAVRHPQARFFASFVLDYLSFDYVRYHDPPGGYLTYSPGTDDFYQRA